MNYSHHQPGSDRLISVRKAAALDIIFHGPRFILAEFAFGGCGCAAIGVFILSRMSHPSFWSFAEGSFFLGVALNYVPLLLYAISIVRGKSAHQEVADELQQKQRYALKYTLQTALFLCLPFALSLLSLYQELHRRSRYKHS
ncbi:MAG: hypothetical protein H0U76_24675 [Ktedonobacteraceae bacterium]|nr:hypothetical protein [Ktedonobacteraceae bacterium]